MIRYACLAAVCGLFLIALPAEPQGFGPRGKGGGKGGGKAAAPAAPRPTPRPATPSFTRPQAPRGQSLAQPRAPSRGFVPNRPATRPVQRPTRPAIPQLTRPSTPTVRPTTPQLTRPTRPNRPPVTIPTRPGSALGGAATRPEPATRPDIIDRTPDRLIRPDRDRFDRDRPRTTIRPDMNRNNNFRRNRTDIDIRNRFVDRSRTINRWGGGRQIGAPRTWFSRPQNWGRTWWGGRPAWFWGRPWYWQHARWHHGFWNFWSYPPALWFGAGLLSGWFLGPGDTFAFYNPYWVAPAIVPAYLNYAEPLPVVSAELDAYALPPDPDELTDPDAPPAAATDPTVTEAYRQLDDARQSFRYGEYAKAQAQVEVAIRLVPSDPALHEFRALTLFAQGQYQEAAATLYAVLTAGPGWDWPTMRDMYADPETYTAQLRSLERFVGERPDAAFGHFLLAYHYLVTGSRDAAVGQLREVVRLQPDDKLAQALLTSLTSPEATGAAAPPAPGR